MNRPDPFSLYHKVANKPGDYKHVARSLIQLHAMMDPTDASGYQRTYFPDDEKLKAYIEDLSRLQMEDWAKIVKDGRKQVPHEEWVELKRQAAADGVQTRSWLW